MMTPRRVMKQIELLSAYLDDQLAEKSRADLERRLAVDADLQAQLEELRRTKHALQSMPALRAPRNFTLTPDMVGGRVRTPRVSLAMAFASAAASILLVVTIAGDILFSVGLPAAMRSAAEPGMVFSEAEQVVEEIPAELDAVEAPMMAEAPPEEEVQKSVETFSDAGDEVPAERVAEAEENEVMEGAGEVGMAESEPDSELEEPAPTQTQVAVADEVVVEATATPAPTEEAETIQEPTPLPAPATPLQLEPRARVSLVRVIEFGLAGIALITGTLALILRRKGSS